MFSFKRLILTAATVICVAGTPTVAAAMPARDPIAGHASSVQVQAPVVSPVQRPSGSPDGFKLGDAGIGAAAMLVLIGVGSAAVTGRRRRGHHPAIG